MKYLSFCGNQRKSYFPLNKESNLDFSQSRRLQIALSNKIIMVVLVTLTTSKVIYIKLNKITREIYPFFFFFLNITLDNGSITKDDNFFHEFVSRRKNPKRNGDPRIFHVRVQRFF